MRWEYYKNFTRNILEEHNKILKVLEIKQLTPTKAERQMGVSQGTLVKLIKRQGRLHESNLEKFIGTFQVNKEWWNTGKGEIFDKKGTYEIKSKAGRAEEGHISYERFIKVLEDKIELLEKRIRYLEGKEPPKADI